MTTCSPADTSCWASIAPNPDAPSTAHMHGENGSAQSNNRWR